MALQHDCAQNKKRRIEVDLETAEDKENKQIVNAINTAQATDTIVGLSGSLACAICHVDIMVDPHVMTMCGHTFCKSCLEKKERYGNSRGLCPTCRTGSRSSPNSWVANVALADVISRVKYTCPFCKSDGLHKAYSKADLKAHISVCSKRKRPCPVPGCGSWLLLDEVEQHNKNHAATHLSLAMDACTSLQKECRKVQARANEAETSLSKLRHTGSDVQLMGPDMSSYDTFSPTGRGADAKPVFRVPSERYPTLESALKEIRKSECCGVVLMKPGVYNVSVNIDSGHVIIMGTRGDGGQRLTTLECTDAKDVVQCSKVGTSVTLVDLDIHQRATGQQLREQTNRFSWPTDVCSHEAVSCDSGCEVQLIRCVCSSSAGPAISMGLSTSSPPLPGVSSGITRLRLNECHLEDCSDADAVLLTGRFKVTVDNCVFNGSNNAIQAWVTPWDRTMCTVLVKDTHVKQYRHRAFFLKYEQFHHPLPVWGHTGPGDASIFTIDNTTVSSTATLVNDGSDHMAVVLECESANGQQGESWFEAGPPHFC